MTKEKQPPQASSGRMTKERFEKMKEIRNELLNFKESPLYEYRTKNKYFPVVGEGSHVAHIMFIGEAPGKNEAQTGRPFCGRAGALLDELLLSISLPRENVYITNIVKDRPPENRDPTPEEIKFYAPFLDRQLSIIKPHVIVTLGRFSMEYIMTRYGLARRLGSIGAIHGELFIATLPYGKVLLMPMYHPAASIYNKGTKKYLEEDFKKLKKSLDELPKS